MVNRPSINRLDWDDWNREHITKHGVETAEVEEVFAGNPMFRVSYKSRLIATGPTKTGRMLTVAIGESPREPGVFYIFSARPSSRRERGLYTEKMGV